MKGTPRASRETSQGVAWLHWVRQLLPETVLIVLAAYLWYRTGQFRQVPPGDLGPDFWPQLLSILLGLAACVRLVRKAVLLRRASRSTAADAVPPVLMRSPNPDAVEEVDEPDVEADDEPIFRGKAATVMALAVGYVLGVIYLGYPLATALFLMVFLWLAGKRNALITVPVSVVGALAFAYIFQKIVFVALPTGVGVFDAFTVWLYRLIGIY